MNSIIESQETFRDEIHKLIISSIKESIKESERNHYTEIKIITFTGFILDKKLW